MPERPGQRPSRQRQPSPRPPRTPAPPDSRGAAIRERLRRDPFLFILCLAALAFVTWAFALTWWVTGAVIPLAVALASLGPAIFLFYLRDA